MPRNGTDRREFGKACLMRQDFLFRSFLFNLDTNCPGEELFLPCIFEINDFPNRVCT